MVPDASFETHRAALTGYCYRMLGSSADADDAVQDTLLRAWKAADALQDPGAARGWLYRIATRVCLDHLATRRRRELPLDLEGPGSASGPVPERFDASRWIEPIPDERYLPVDADPAERLALRERTRIAWVAALQRLPPRQRAVLLLREVVGWSAAEVAASLETSVASVNSALQRARSTLDQRPTGDSDLLEPTDEAQRALLARYVTAFEAYDVDALCAVLHEDATLSMPPYALWLRGREEIARWLLGPGHGCRGSRLVPLRANGSPAFGQYRPDGPWAVIVLDLAGGRIRGMCSYLDTGTLFPMFGLPPSLSGKFDGDR
ncbi:MAG: sigma-70 family RNA polymerase sigma factor [Alphaproteobacteria bacterium]|nr:sigma-70 family RNA polymerase sigma factor [Alphaproteobacteria bacterium]MCB9699808.1 sigma-70 family RNA polymerase sigma factor [Alphaproteobacteria bacterium]